MKKWLGFTLTELGMVGVILMVLITSAVFNFRLSAQKARDVQRKADLKAIQEGLERFRSNQRFPGYPLAASWRNDLETGGFMQVVPEESKLGWPGYSYIRDEGDDLKYAAVVCLENAGDLYRDKVNVCDQGYSYTLTEKEK